MYGALYSVVCAYFTHLLYVCVLCILQKRSNWMHFRSFFVALFCTPRRREYNGNENSIVFGQRCRCPKKTFFRWLTLYCVRIQSVRVVIALTQKDLCFRFLTEWISPIVFKHDGLMTSAVIPSNILVFRSSNSSTICRMGLRLRIC